MLISIFEAMHITRCSCMSYLGYLLIFDYASLLLLWMGATPDLLPHGTTRACLLKKWEDREHVEESAPPPPQLRQSGGLL